MRAVITGCNRGLGEGIALTLLNNDWEVIGLNRTKSLNTELTNNRNFTEHQCNVSILNDVCDISTRIGVGDINLLVINAGIRRFNTIEDMNILHWQESIDTNLTGAFYITKALIDKVKKSMGDVVIIGSHSEKYTFETGSAYCSTKGALKEFAECLMQEVRYDNVRVSYLSLGSIKNRDHGIDEEWKLKPTEVGGAVLSLVSLPKNVMIPYLDIRPIKPLRDEKPGIEKLQYV